MPQSNVWYRRLAKGAALGAPILMALHRSSDPALLGRYSVFYGLLLAGSFAAAALFAFGNGLGRLRRVAMRLGPTGALSRRELGLSLAVVVLAHAVLAGFILSPTSVFDRAPLTHVDYAMHTHQLEVAVPSLLGSGRGWAYDPFFCAGYPEGALSDVDMKLAEILCLCLTLLGVPLAVAFKLVVFVSFLAVPFVLWAAAAALEWDNRTTLFATVAGVLVWHSHSLLVAFTGSGMFSFVFAVYLAVLACALAIRFLARGGRLVWLALALVLSATMMAHVTGVILVGPPMLAAAVASRPSRNRILGLVAALLLAGASNVWWIIPLAHFFPLKLETAFWPAPALRQLGLDLIHFRDRDILLGALGCWGFWTSRRRAPVSAYSGIVAIAAFAGLSRLSAPIPLLASLEPARFSIPMIVWAALGAAAAVASLGGSDVRLLKASGTAFPVVLSLAALLAPLFVAIGEPRQSITARDSVSQDALVRWIGHNTNPGERIAFEDASPGDLSGAWLRSRVDRELIGGPFSQLNLVHSYASFTNERFFDRAIADLSEEDLELRANQFAIRFVVAHTPAVSDKLRSFKRKLALRTEIPIPGDEPSLPEERSPFAHYVKARKGMFCVFEVLDPTTLVAEGAGEARAGLDRITVRGATAGRTVLRYHWLPTLQTVPRLPIRERRFLNQPIGFIEVENGGVSNFVIVNGG